MTAAKPIHAVTALALAVVWSGGCNGATPQPDFAPAVLSVSPDAATGPDYVAEAVIDSAGDADWFELRLARPFNSVVVMTAGDTDTEGRVETRQRAPITAACSVAERHKAEPPCVWGYDPDIAPDPGRSEAFNRMPASRNFLWEGSLGAGTYYIRVAGKDGATGAYVLMVELGNQDCPTYYCDE